MVGDTLEGIVLVELVLEEVLVLLRMVLLLRMQLLLELLMEV